METTSDDDRVSPEILQQLVKDHGAESQQPYVLILPEDSSTGRLISRYQIAEKLASAGIQVVIGDVTQALENPLPTEMGELVKRVILEYARKQETVHIIKMLDRCVINCIKPALPPARGPTMAQCKRERLHFERKRLDAAFARGANQPPKPRPRQQARARKG